MDANRFDSLAITRSLTKSRTRRMALGGALLGALGLAGSDAAQVVAADACKLKCSQIKNQKARLKCRKRRSKCRKNRSGDRQNACRSRNWCVNRSHTCGPAGGYGKCLLGLFGDNVCAEILFQAKSCDACAEPMCSNCRCALAAGGGDRCNNGVNGWDYICVRDV